MPQVVPFIPAIVGAGASLLGAKKNASATSRAAAAATPTPYGVSGPFGSMAVNGRNLSLSQPDNPFGTMFNALGMSSLANAATAPGAYLYGADPQIAEAYKGLFGQGLTTGIQDQLSLLRNMAAPEERRQGLALDDRLQARGQLGTSGGAEQLRAFQEAKDKADLDRQFFATERARQTALDRFTGAIQGTSQGMGAQLQQYNIGSGSFGGLNELFANLLRTANLGIGAASGTPGDVAMANRDAQMQPWVAGMEAVRNTGVFDRLGGGSLSGIPTVSQPNMGPVNVSAPANLNWMPSGQFGL
jgi:hypothetical protein